VILNEFYFVTPATLVTVTEIPPECGLLVVEAGFATFAQWKNLTAPRLLFQLRSRHQGVLHNHRLHHGAILPAQPGSLLWL
jgi:hypothetical protein